MSKHPISYEDYSKASRYRIQRARRAGRISSDSSDDSANDTVQNKPPAPLYQQQSPRHVSEDEVEPFSSPAHEPEEPDADVDEVMVDDMLVDNPEASDSDREPSTDRSSVLNENGGFSDDDPSSDPPDSSDGEEGPAGVGNGEPDPLLYTGAPITLSQSMISVLSLSMSHNLTGSCLADILELISIHCPEPNHCISSLYLFRKYFANIRTPLEYHYYCSACFTSLATKDTVCGECRENKGIEYFLEIPVLSQLKSLFARPGFYELLNHRFTRRKQCPENYEDIYDGALYKELSAGNNILASRSNISLMWYTDGVKIFRSSKYEVWPLFLSINELPYSQRFKKDNVILAGLWFGLRKPVPELFIDAFRRDKETLYNGVYFNVPQQLNPIHVRGLVLCGTCDMPAKALFLNMKQWNADFGCHKCKTKGERIYRDAPDEEQAESDPDDPGENNNREHQHRGPGVNVYPSVHDLELRTDAETAVHARTALESNRSVLGVKGPSSVASLVRNYIRSTALDLMHILMNLVKQQNNFWFDQSFNLYPSSLRRYVKVIDKRIKSVTPPQFVQRLPRSIEEHGAYWKASELKMWLFYYSLPILRDLMEPHYFEHHKLTVMGLYLLCQSSISEEMLNLARRLITEYVSRYEDLYGRRFMSCCVHSLLHLPDVVRDLGPLWTTSCFPFEGLNGSIKAFIHGTRFADLQICNAASMFHNFTALKQENLLPGSRAQKFCERMSRRSLKLKCHQISPTLSITGQCQLVNPLPVVVQDALDNAGVDGRNIRIFNRLLLSRFLYCSVSYAQSLKTNSSCVKYIVDGITRIGLIQCFVRVTDCLCRELCQCNSRIFAVIQKCVTGNPFITDAPHVPLTFIYQCTPGDTEAVNVECFSTVCFYFVSNDVAYAVEPVNCLEVE